MSSKMCMYKKPWSVVQHRSQRHRTGGTTKAGYHQWPEADQQHCSPRKAEALVPSVRTAACLMWPISIYEVTLSHANRLERLVNVQVRKWLGLPRCLSSIGMYNLWPSPTRQRGPRTGSINTHMAEGYSS